MRASVKRSAGSTRIRRLSSRRRASQLGLARPGEVMFILKDIQPVDGRPAQPAAADRQPPAACASAASGGTTRAGCHVRAPAECGPWPIGAREPEPVASSARRAPGSDMLFDMAESPSSPARGAGGTPGGVGPFFIGLIMAAAGGYLLLNQVQVTTSFWRFGAYGGFGLTLHPAARRRRRSCSTTAGRRRLAAHRHRGDGHPGRRPDEHGHLLPPDQPVQHADDARAAVRRPRPARPLAALTSRYPGSITAAAVAAPRGSRRWWRCVRTRTGT